MNCADCGKGIANDNSLSDGWQLEDGRTVCHKCCAEDTLRVIREFIKSNKLNNDNIRLPH